MITVLCKEQREQVRLKSVKCADRIMDKRTDRPYIVSARLFATGGGMHANRNILKRTKIETRTKRNKR